MIVLGEDRDILTKMYLLYIQHNFKQIILKRASLKC